MNDLTSQFCVALEVSANTLRFSYRLHLFAPVLGSSRDAPGFTLKLAIYLYFRQIHFPTRSYEILEVALRGFVDFRMRQSRLRRADSPGGSRRADIFSNHRSSHGCADHGWKSHRRLA